MRPFRSVLFAAVTAIGLLHAGAVDAQPVSFQTKDDVTVFGDFRPALKEPRGTIVLFHMAGSNKSEYAPLAPVLNDAGFATLAIDQRSGGDFWGAENLTAAGLQGNPDYADALPDMEAALAFASAQGIGPVAVWGSSYSSALVFVLAARHPEVKALLAFSPAEYISGYSIEAEASKLVIPVFVTSASDDGEIASARRLALAVGGHRAVQYIPTSGVHGSSTLRSDQNPQGAVENWRHVMAFLDTAFARR
jgi:dienelactone hydrolase